MVFKVVVHKEPTGGYWAEVPALPGCMTQGESQAELESNLREAIEGWLMAGDAAHPVQDSEDIELLERAI